MITRRRTYIGSGNERRGFRYVLTDKGVIDFDLIEDSLETGNLPIVDGTQDYYSILSANKNSVDDFLSGVSPYFIKYNSDDLSILMRLKFSNEEDSSLFSTYFPGCQYDSSSSYHPEVGSKVELLQKASYSQSNSIITTNEDNFQPIGEYPINVSALTSKGELITFLVEGSLLSSSPTCGIIKVNNSGVVEKILSFKKLNPWDEDWCKSPFSFPYTKNSLGFVLPVSGSLIFVSVRSKAMLEGPAEICYVLDVDTLEYWIFNTVVYSLYYLF